MWPLHYPCVCLFKLKHFCYGMQYFISKMGSNLLTVRFMVNFMIFRRQVLFCTDTILTSEKCSNFAEEATRLFFQATCLPLLSALLLAQPLSDQILVNRAFCGKSMKLSTAVHHTKSSKFSYSAKPDFPCGGCGGHLKKWPLCHPISETKRHRAIIVDSI